MKNRLQIKISCILTAWIFLISPVFVWAEGGGGNGKGGTPAPTKGSGAALGGEVGIGAALAASDAAKQASSQQADGSSTNFVMGGVMIAVGTGLQFTACCSEMGIFMIVQGGMGLIQAAMQAGTSDGNNAAANDFLTGGGPLSNGSGSTKYGTIPGTSDKDKISPNGPAVPAPPGFDTNVFSKLTPEAQNALTKLVGQGYKFDIKGGTVTTPEGVTVTGSDAANGSALEAKLDLPAGTAAKGMEMMAEIAKRNGASNAAGLASTGGAGDMGADGGGDGSGLAEGEGYDGSGGKLSGKDKLAQKNRLPASAVVAGLTSRYNGDLIGVAADDIFLMVRRRYKLKSEQDSFLTSDRPARGILGNLRN